MNRAFQLAALAEGKTSPNPLVGAVVLDDSGQLVGEGFHSKAGESHAEIKALNQAGINSKNGTLIVTLEPCCHFGRTPPCTEAIIQAGIRRVVVALKDPDPRVSGDGLLKLKEAGIEVIEGVLEEKAAIQNKDFIFRVNSGRPLGILKWAMSLDGRISLPNGESKWISNAKSRNWVHRLRSKCDAVVVGGETLRKDNPLLTSRGFSNPEPIRVVFTRSLDFPRDLLLWETDVAKTLVAYCPTPELESKLKNFPKGPELLALRSSSLKCLAEALAKKGCNRVLWECGPSLASLAIQENCIQELAVVIAPKLIGGKAGTSPLENFGFTSIDQGLHLENYEIGKIDNDFLMTMMLDKNES